MSVVSCRLYRPFRWAPTRLKEDLRQVVATITTAAPDTAPVLIMDPSLLKRLNDRVDFLSEWTPENIAISVIDEFKIPHHPPNDGHKTEPLQVVNLMDHIKGKPFLVEGSLATSGRAGRQSGKSLCGSAYGIRTHCYAFAVRCESRPGPTSRRYRDQRCRSQRRR